MAKNIYFGVGGKARNVKNAYIGINGKARKIKNAYIGVNGKARLVWSSGIVATISTSGTVINKADVRYNNVQHITNGETFDVNAGDIIELSVRADSFSSQGYVYVNGDEVFSNYYSYLQTYEWTVPSNVSSISIALSNPYGNQGIINVTTT